MKQAILRKLPGLMLAAGLVLPVAQAQSPQWRNPNPDITRAELAHFDNFLDSHPQIDRELRRDPRLIDDPNYVRNHPELGQFLRTHPGVREEARETPNYFMHREERFERSGRDLSRGELARADGFFDRHPEVENELRHDPRLVDDPRYMAAHPGLKDFLDHHPEMRHDLKSHPEAFMRREGQYERHEDRDRDHDRDKGRDRKWRHDRDDHDRKWRHDHDGHERRTGWRH